MYLQVNTSAEAQKGGVPPEEAPRVAAAIAKMPYLHLAGLMTIGKFGDISPKYFESL